MLARVAAKAAARPAPARQLSAAAAAALRIGDKVPDFEQDSSKGTIKFHEFVGGSWAVLFSHPKDYTPVCTTELGEVQRLLPEFEKRNVKPIALSVDTPSSHNGWIEDIKDTQGVPDVAYPILADADRSVSEKYGMLDQTNINADGLPLTVRSVFVIDPNKTLRLTFTYPASTGRNFDELLRVIDSLQMTDHHKLATPANWKPGDDCVVVPSVSTEEAKELFPAGVCEVRPYLRLTPDPTK